MLTSAWKKAERADGRIAVKASFHKMRGMAEPAASELVYENGEWQSVCSPPELNEQAQWLFAEMERRLDKCFLVKEFDHPVVYTADVREAFRERWSADHHNQNTLTKCWTMAKEALVTYFDFLDTHSMRKVKP